MSRLLVLAPADLVPGFFLAGVDAFAAEDPESGQELIESWWRQGERGLLFIEEGLFAGMAPAFIRKMEAYEPMPYLTFPGGGPGRPGASRRALISEMIRRAVGVQITFKGEEEETAGS